MLFLLLLLAMVSASAAEKVTDEATRLQALAAIFPKTSVKLTGERLDDSGRFHEGNISFETPDALRSENVYEIVGPPSGDSEGCASDDVLKPGRKSSVREVRFEMFKVAAGEYVAIVQYRFPRANPAMACPSIARVVLLEGGNGKLTTVANRDLETMHHGGIEMIRFAPLRAPAAEQLIVESDAGGAGTGLIELYIFDFSSRHIVQLFVTDVFAHAVLEKLDFFSNVAGHSPHPGAKRPAFLLYEDHLR